MKTATLPSLRVDPQLRDAAQSVLNEGESLSAFMESAVRDSIERRRSRAEFVARGLASRDEARDSGVYFAADTVHAELASRLEQARAALASGPTR